jgi:hypothetical protein
VKRKIIENEGGVLRLVAKSIGDYDRDFLKEQFLASLEGKAWRERDDAVRGFMRWLGFAKLTEAISESGASIINGLLREGRLEKADTRIRRSS